ncbi:MAG: CoA pyrophosphatase [Bacteroidales bacterium]|nr:CoA pyrophosphatase [Bacteroidales bacterium]
MKRPLKHDHFTDRLAAALKKDLPGTGVQWEMASSDRKVKDYPRKKRSDSKMAAVLILLYPHDDSLYTVFIERPVYKGVHSGQISFPGGKMELTDANLLETAVRETCEETGLCNDQLKILGKLTALYIPVSNTEVSPYVAFCHHKPQWKVNKDEVVSLIEAPLMDFFDKEMLKGKNMTVRNELLRVKYYDFKGRVIWGATAMMLHELLALIKREGLL